MPVDRSLPTAIPVAARGLYEVRAHPDGKRIAISTHALRHEFFMGLGDENGPSARNAMHYNCSARSEGVVEDQITVRLPASLGRTLRRTSRRLGRRPSAVVRMALEAFLQGAPVREPGRTR